MGENDPHHSATPVPLSGRATAAISALIGDTWSRAEAARLAAIVESSDDAIVSKTLDGIIITWNKGAERIFGYHADEVIGKSIVLLIPPDRQGEEPVILDKLRRGERIEHYETVRVRKDGMLINVAVTISPLRDSSGVIIGAPKIARDVTRQKQIESELRTAKETAESASRAKDHFLSVLSHEQPALRGAKSPSAMKWSMRMSPCVTPSA